MLDLANAGLILVIAGFAVVFVSLFSRAKETKTGVKGAGVLMIGPIPIIFGTDAKWASIAIVLAIALLLVYLFGVL